MEKTASRLVIAAGIAIGATVLAPGPANAQSLSWFVFKNCVQSPCTIGVAEYSYAVPGNQRYREGWRRAAGGFNGGRQAWRTACRMYKTGQYRSPDIRLGRVNCRALGI